MTDQEGVAWRDPEPRPDSPRFHVWPPVAIAVPWAVGFVLGRALGGEADLGAALALIGWACISAFVAWNGWCLLLFARARTGLLPGQSTTRLLASGPYRFSRNPLYVGLLLLYAGSALVADAVVTLVLLPVAWAGLHWGAVLPEERYLTAALGAPYEQYCDRVRRWL
jgi:protein-S-isoprenylcysteine O-methyltransferase Ste14